MHNLTFVDNINNIDFMLSLKRTTEKIQSDFTESYCFPLKFLVGYISLELQILVFCGFAELWVYSQQGTISLQNARGEALIESAWLELLSCFLCRPCDGRDVAFDVSQFGSLWLIRTSIQLSKQEKDADSLQCPSVYVSRGVMQGLKLSCGQHLM